MTDLTTLAHVKGWMGITALTDPVADAVRDVLINRLIRASSTFMESVLSRSFLSQVYIEKRNGSGAGQGRYMMAFANDPVSSMLSLAVDGIVLPASIDGGLQQNGYGFDADAVWVAPFGTGFSKGQRNVALSYIGGFLVLPFGQYSDSRWLLPAEQQVIPISPFQITPQNLWLADNGVTFVLTGTALVKVASAPAAGQYMVSTVSGTPGVYTFNTADAGKTVALSYSYVPADIEQACVELISLRFIEKSRIGVVSLAVGTESTTFYQKDMPAQMATDLLQYKRVFVL